MNPDDIWSEALQEAYASAPTEEVILHTLELRHVSFGSDAVRVVQDTGKYHPELGDDIYGHYMTLESNAPMDAGESVFFSACMIDMTIPEQREGSLPTIEIQLDNVTKTIMGYLDNAINVRAPMDLSYREYLYSDLTTPQFVMHGLSIKNVKANLTRVVATASFADLNGKSFPKKLYRPSEFRSLAAS